jgi:hypothetical protein
VLEFARIESFLPHFRGLPGQPVEDCASLARSFIAKAVFDITGSRPALTVITSTSWCRRCPQR